jgi:hypothetical protein
MAGYLAPATIGGVGYLAPAEPPAVVTPPPDPDPDPPPDPDPGIDPVPTVQAASVRMIPLNRFRIRSST